MCTVRGDVLAWGYTINVRVNQHDTDYVHLQGMVLALSPD